MKQLQEVFLALFEQFKILFPKLVIALVLIIGGWLVSYVVAKLFKRLLITVKIDRLSVKLQEIDLVERSGLRLQLSSILASTLYYIMLLVFLIAASDAVGLQVVSEQVANVIQFIPRLVSALMVFVGGLLLANFARTALYTALRSLGVQSGKLISEVIFYFIVLTITITALEQGGMNTAFLTSNIQILLAGLIIAFALGFGLSSKEVLRQLIAANYNRRKYQVGDYVRVKEYTGRIVAVESTSITLLLANESKVVIPQTEILNGFVELLPDEPQDWN
jgi:small-conductance mechanosensitive channel